MPQLIGNVVLTSETLVEPQDRKALEDIEKFGCHVINVMEDEEGPAFSYSIGINKQQSKPDLIIVGLKNELAHSIINNYNDRLINSIRQPRVFGRGMTVNLSIISGPNQF